MLGTLIILLQEESERICGTALPEEMCRKILIEQGGQAVADGGGVEKGQGATGSPRDDVGFELRSAAAARFSRPFGGG